MKKANGNGQPQGLPHSEECERAVLAAFNVASIQGRPSAVDRLLDQLTTEAFYLERHRFIFEAVRSIRGRDEPVDMRTLQGELELTGNFEVVGGFAYLAGLDLDLPDLGRVDTYASIVRERWARRSMIIKASEASSRGLDGEAAEVLIADLQQALLEIEQARAVGGNFRSIFDVIQDLDFENPSKNGMLGLGSGLVDLDRVTCGFQAGHLIVIAGRPSMGKTSLAVQVALHQAVREGARVGFVSLEDIERRIAYKILSQESGVPHQQIAQSRVSRRQKDRLYAAVREVSPANLWINDKESQTVEQVCSSARIHAVRHGLDALYVDYVNLMNAAGRWDTRNLEVGHISKALKALAKSLEIPVVLLCQLKRLTPENREPRLSDLRDSGELEQNADVAVFVHRPEVFDENHDPGIAYLIVDKNKGGVKGKSIGTYFLGETTSFKDLDRHPEPEPARSYGWAD